MARPSKSQRGQLKKSGKRREKTIMRSGYAVPVWGDADETQRQVLVWCANACQYNPEFSEDMAHARNWVARHVNTMPLTGFGIEQADSDSLPADRRAILVQTRAFIFLQSRYPRIWQYPAFLNRQLAYTALHHVLCTGNWSAASIMLAEWTGSMQKILKYPVGSEVYRGGYRSAASGREIQYSPRDAKAFLSTADNVAYLAERGVTGPVTLAPGIDPSPSLGERLWYDDGEVEINGGLTNPLYILEGRPGYTRKDAHDALDRALDATEKRYPEFLKQPEGGRDCQWEHLPEIYRFWRQHPTRTPERPDLTAGKTLVSWEIFTTLILDSDSKPAHWKGNDNDWPTSVKTVENDTKAAIEWLAPEPGITL